MSNTTPIELANANTTASIFALVYVNAAETTDVCRIRDIRLAEIVNATCAYQNAQRLLTTGLVTVTGTVDDNPHLVVIRDYLTRLADSK